MDPKRKRGIGLEKGGERRLLVLSEPGGTGGVGKLAQGPVVDVLVNCCPRLAGNGLDVRGGPC